MDTNVLWQNGVPEYFFPHFPWFCLILATVEPKWLDCSQNESKSRENVEKSIRGPHSCHKTLVSIPPTSWSDYGGYPTHFWWKILDFLVKNHSFELFDYILVILTSEMVNFNPPVKIFKILKFSILFDKKFPGKYF